MIDHNILSMRMKNMDLYKEKKVLLNEKSLEFEFEAFRFVWWDKKLTNLILPDTEINHNSGILVNDLFSQTTYFLSDVINSVNHFCFIKLFSHHHFFQKRQSYDHF